MLGLKSDTTCCNHAKISILSCLQTFLLFDDFATLRQDQLRLEDIIAIFLTALLVRQTIAPSHKAKVIAIGALIELVSVFFYCAG